jgi:hypothetical protein
MLHVNDFDPWKTIQGNRFGPVSRPKMRSEIQTGVANYAEFFDHTSACFDPTH